ncbi:hypothetical protein RCL_jg4994.t1 [Rhizophagus clarus]|uniref:Uncharacterized protein n=1 Tax=Rhizophagus clarus TaxID=94130 RepID=A0A8H3QJU2_9GLOM|nr:hypothetical protein RCL_jg4994.t1 [Rhizophagus clarus]
MKGKYKINAQRTYYAQQLDLLNQHTNKIYLPPTPYCTSYYAPSQQFLPRPPRPYHPSPSRSHHYPPSRPHYRQKYEQSELNGRPHHPSSRPHYPPPSQLRPQYYYLFDVYQFCFIRFDGDSYLIRGTSQGAIKRS